MWGPYAGQAEKLLDADETTLPASQYFQIDTHIDAAAWSNDRVSSTSFSSLLILLLKKKKDRTEPLK